MSAETEIIIACCVAILVCLFLVIWLDRPLRCPVCKTVQQVPAKRRGRYSCEHCGSFWIDERGRTP